MSCLIPTESVREYTSSETECSVRPYALKRLYKIRGTNGDVANNRQKAACLPLYLPCILYKYSCQHNVWEKGEGGWKSSAKEVKMARHMAGAG